MVKSEDPGEKSNWFCISTDELEKNEIDPGFMFCEDCHQFHLITYRRCIEEDGETILRNILGFYECKECEQLWSINGKRVD